MKTRKRHHSKRCTRKHIGGQPQRRMRPTINSNKALQKRRNASIKLAKKRRQNNIASRRKAAFKNTLEELKQETNITDIELEKTYDQCLRFIALFVEKADNIAQSNNFEKENNYSMFAEALKENLKEVNKKYRDVIDEDDLKNNGGNPNEYLEDYVNLVESEDILDNFKEVALKQYNGIINENTEKEYYKLTNFLLDSIKAVKETIKEYSLKKSIKEVNNANVNALIFGLTGMSVGNKNENINMGVPKNKNTQMNELFDKFLALGL